MSAAVCMPNICEVSLRVAGSLRRRPDRRLEQQRFRVTRQPHCRETSRACAIGAAHPAESSGAFALPANSVWPLPAQRRV